MNIIDQVRKHLPPKNRQGPAGWISFNCPACKAAGELREDDRGRGGIMFTPSGGITYNCFNCKTVARWEPGSQFSTKMKFVLKQLGISSELIRKMNFEAWRMKELVKVDENALAERYQKLELKFEVKKLPNGAKSFNEWLLEDPMPAKCAEAIQYINNRSSHLLTHYDFYWSPNRKNTMNERVIVPFIYKGDIVGYNARLFTDGRDRYYGNIPANYLFNNQALYKNKRKYVLIVEGIFDALAIDGVAALGSTLSKEQRQWINESGLFPVVITDKDKGGQTLIDAAIEEKWSVSFPYWEEGVGDPAEAVEKYGRLFTIKSIIDNIETNKVAINVKRKRWYDGRNFNKST